MVVIDQFRFLQLFKDNLNNIVYYILTKLIAFLNFMIYLPDPSK